VEDDPSSSPEQSEEDAPPPGYVRGPVPLDPRRPANRHDLMRLGAKDSAKRGSKLGETINTIIEPWVDVEADMTEMRIGRAHYHAGQARIWVNGRTYGMHVSTNSGTIFPIAGPGFVPLTGRQHQALRVFVHYNGINTRSEYELSRDNRLTDLDREIARRLWRLREREQERRNGTGR